MAATAKIHSSVARELPRQSSATLRSLMVSMKRLKHTIEIETDVQGVPVLLNNVIDRKSWDMKKSHYKGRSHHVALVKNSKATDVTLARVVKLILSNPTVQANINSKTASVGKTYRKGSFMCADFATILCNDAEAAGIRCGEVFLRYKWRKVGHALNVFNTTDHGLVFYDPTYDMIMSEKLFFNQGKDRINDSVTKKFPVENLSGFRAYFHAGLRSVEILW